MRKRYFGTIRILQNVQLEVVFEMDQGNVSAKFKGKSDSYNEQRQHTQVAENP